ncbi:MAG: DEAD/DEAH box helicase [Muribaculaceae bacterium]|nr:DEAD/DEAH box helicase [Muribaculaceae bacterium]
MKQSVIINNIKQRLGIGQLNEMQQEVARTTASQMLLLSPTGSGKTVAFSIALLRTLTAPRGKVQAVVIAPARELVMQIAEVIRLIAVGFKTVACYGGHSMIDEARSLTSSVPDIIVATPGRLLDHLNRGNVDLVGVNALVLDEYDKALDLGFHDEMRKVVRPMRSLLLTVLTSATALDDMPSFVNFKSPKILDYTEKTEAPRHRMQVVNVASPVRDKLQSALDLLRSLPNGKVILFVNHRESASRVYDFLRKNRMPVGLYHGGLEQIDREKAIDLLNNGTTPILVSTDLASRGLDIDHVQAVVHYHMPPSPESWTHRNGRTARMGAEGTVYVITAEGENIPDYIDFDRDYVPLGESDDPIKSDISTLHFNAGKKEKISRGDVVGFMINKGGLESSQVGKIMVKDHCVLVAMPRNRADEVLTMLAPHKIKNKRVRITKIKV